MLHHRGGAAYAAPEKGVFHTLHRRRGAANAAPERGSSLMLHPTEGELLMLHQKKEAFDV